MQTQDDIRPIDKVHAALYYIRHHYFLELRRSGLNALLSIPILKSSSSLPSLALTSASFRIHSDQVVTRKNWAQMASSFEPVLLVLGMTAFRSPPSASLEGTTDWIVNWQRSSSEAIICLSRDIVTDRTLLLPLARISTMTTIVPIISPVDTIGEWTPQFTALVRDQSRKNRSCSWTTQEPDKEGSLKWKWERRVAFHYEQEGDGIASGACSASCEFA